MTPSHAATRVARVPGRTTGGDLVPLADRVRYLQVFRYLAVSAALAWVVALPSVRLVPWRQLLVVCGGYLVLTALAHLWWRVGRRRALWLFGLLLLVDGVFLAWLGGVATTSAGPARHLVVVHLVTVALLASFRTGLKTAVWHGLLLLTVFHARELGLLTVPGGAVRLGDATFRETCATAVVFLAVAMTTSSFAAVNERELRRRRFDLEALARLALELETVHAPAQIAERVVSAVVDDFDLPRVVLLGFDADGVVRLLSARPGPASGARTWTPAAGSLVAVLREERRTQLVTHADPLRDPELDLLLRGARNLIGLPLTADGRAVGVLVVEHGLRRGSRVERSLVTMLERFAAHAGLALANAHLLAQVQRQAARDGLTGLANRRTLDEALAREVAEVDRSGRPLALLLLDVDHFKRLNDTYGHATGDEALRQLAGLLAAAGRETDLAARYGGEEFVLLLPDTDATGAGEVAERVRAAVAAHGDPVPMTVSIGLVCVHPGDAADPAAVLSAADAALYSAKHAGRDRVVVAERSPAA